MGDQHRGVAGRRLHAGILCLASAARARVASRPQPRATPSTLTLRRALTHRRCGAPCVPIPPCGGLRSTRIAEFIALSHAADVIAKSAMEENCDSPGVFDLISDDAEAAEKVH